MAIPRISTDPYHYELPAERIAQHPLAERDASRLLCWRDGHLSERIFRELPGLIPEGSLLVFNNTRVIRARLFFRKSTGSLIELFCLEPLKPFREPQLSLQQTGTVTWKCLVGHAKKWKNGTLSLEVVVGGVPVTLQACGCEALGDGTFAITFVWTPATFSFGEVLEAAGRIPLPPYIHRESAPDDLIRYQTIYARLDGSVAAPTAGLHFTGGVLQELSRRAIGTTSVTLHVGLGTFRPMTSPDVTGHVMHREQVIVSQETIHQLLRAGDRPMIAVGTTSVRTLESLYWIGVKLREGGSGDIPTTEQWDPYEIPRSRQVPVRTALTRIAAWLEERKLTHLTAETQLMIVPGYEYRLISGMITNFHQPRSTLLLLVAAFLGDSWREAYRYALARGFRFLSYGDSCFFLKTTTARKDP